MKLIHVSAAMSLDGCIDDTSSKRLVLSSAEDLRDMHIARAECEAILVGANTIRKDNPSLKIDSPDLVDKRIKNGKSAELVKVTVTRTGDISLESRFFTYGEGQKIIICPKRNEPAIAEKLSSVAQIVSIDEVNPISIVKALEALGIQSLFVEGGTSILTMFLSEGVFHRFRLAMAPFFVGDTKAPKLVSDAIFKNNNQNQLVIKDIKLLGNTTVVNIENKDFCNA